MKKKSKSAGHSTNALQFLVASKRSAIHISKPIKPKRSASIQKAGHGIPEFQSMSASSGATQEEKPINRLPRTNKRGQHAREDHHVAASQRPAARRIKSKDDMQDAPISNGHSAFENQPPDAIAADDHRPLENHNRYVIGSQSKRGHLTLETQSSHASLGNDQRLRENQSATVIPTIRELWKNRQAWHRAEKSLTLQGKAQCRRFTEGDKTEANKLFASLERIADGQGKDEARPAIASAILPFIEARKPLEAHRKLIEKELTRLAKSLPIYPWAENIQGFGAMSLAAIVGEAGDLSNYATPSRLWKRMGLAVINGKRQRRVSDAIEALEHGYSPSRRSVMFNIGGCLIGGMGRGPRPKCGEDVHLMIDLSPYQKRFIDLIRREVERVTDTWNGPEHKREPVEKNGKLYESYSSHAANRIRRRIEKEFLCDLLVAWKACQTTHDKKPISGMSDKPTILEAAE